jgi:hypothetical protein
MSPTKYPNTNKSTAYLDSYQIEVLAEEKEEERRLGRPLLSNS